VSLTIGALMAVGFVAPAHAISLPSLTVYLSSKSGSPIGGASVTLVPMTTLAVDPTKSVVGGTETGLNSGTYEFAAGTIVSGQQYVLQFEGANGAYPQYYGNSVTPDAATQLTFTGNTHNTIEASIDANVTIKGKVTTPTGTAAKDIIVVAYRWDGRSWQMHGNYPTTSSSGTYTINEIDPGSYKLFFLDPTSRGYLPVYSGGAATLDSAMPTYVALGGTATVNQKLSKGGTIAGKASYTFAGTTDAATGMYAIAYTLTPDGIGGFSGVNKEAGYFYGDSTSSSGKWTIPGLPTGTYVVKLLNDGSFLPSDELEEVYIGSSSATHYKAWSWDTAYRFVVKAGSTTTRTQVTTLDLKSEAPISTLQVHVKDSGVTAIEGAEVTIESSDNEDFYFGPNPFNPADDRSLTNSSGNVLVPRIPVGNYTITVVDPATTPSYQPFSETFHYDGFGGTKTISLGGDTSNGFSTLTLSPDVSVPSNRAVGTLYTVTAVGSQPGSTITYQWLRDGQVIFGAKSSTYTTQSGDVGKYVTCLVTASRRGLLSNTLSTPIGTVTSGGQISSLDPVTITPATGVQPATVLTARSGDWDVPKVSLSYQWFSDGDGTATTWTPIDDATSKTYTTTLLDAEANIRVEVTASKLGYTDSDSVVSDPVNVGLANTLTVTKAPKITKSTSGGTTTFSATPGTWSVAGASYFYTWYNDTTVVDAGVDVTSGTFANDGQANRVRIDAHKAGYDTGTYVIVLRKGTGDPVLSGTTTISQTAPSEEISSATQSVQPGSQLYFSQSPTWTFPDHTGGFSRSWQWYRQFGSGPVSAIKGATADSYTAKDADIGAKISVIEKATKGALYVTSGQTAHIPAGLVVARPTLVTSPATVSILGTGTIGSKLSASVSPWPGVSGVTQKFQWKSCDANTFGDCFSAQDHYVAISGATSSTFTPGASLSGFALEVVVTGSKKYYAPATVLSVPFALNSDATVFTAVTSPALTGGLSSGVAHVGTKVTLTPAAYDRPGIVKQYEWQLCDADVAAGACTTDVGWSTVLSTTATTYTPTPADISGGADHIRVRQLGTLSGGGSRFDRSDAYELVAGIPKLLTAPKITTTGTTFTVSTGTWSPTGTFSYQWYADGVDVGGDSPIFDRTADDYSGKPIHVVVTAIGGAGYGQATTIVVAAKGLSPTSTPGELTISGGAFGGTLSVSGSPFHYIGSLDPLETRTYQWYSGTKAISGAKSNTFKPSSSLIGKSLKVKITSSSARYGSASYTTPAITLAKGTILDAPDVSGNTGPTNRPGTILTADVSGYVPSTVAKSFVWQRQPGGGGPWLTISGAKKSTYTATTADAGGNVRVVVTATKTGYTTSVEPSAPVAVDYLLNFAVLTRPTLSGVGTVGTPLTLDQGSVDISGITKTQQWYRNGVELPGVTGVTYTPLSSSYNDDISVEVTYSKLGYASLTYASNAITIGLGAAPVPTATPSISGGTHPGDTLTANTAGSPAIVKWNLSGLTFDYQWYVDPVGPTGSTAVDDATGHSLVIPGGALTGDSYSLELVVHREGYNVYYTVTNSISVVVVP
jgi:hypothetical protein